MDIATEMPKAQRVIHKTIMLSLLYYTLFTFTDGQANAMFVCFYITLTKMELHHTVEKTKLT